MRFKQSKALAISALLLFLGYAAYDVAQLQAGLIEPAEKTLQAADQITRQRLPIKSVTDYPELMVPVTDNVQVTVAVRETAFAEANLFLIHGAASGAWAWEYFFEHVPQKFNIYAINWRGHFTSSPVKNARSADYVADQEAVLSMIASRSDLPIHIIGHSYGGATAILQAAQTNNTIESIMLLAPVVPLDYTLIQRLIVPHIAPYFIAKDTDNGNDPNGVFGGMFLSSLIMQDYFKRYASADHAKEKPDLIAGDGVSTSWQRQLLNAYISVSDSRIPITIISARYDNVVVLERQQNLATQIGANFIVVDSGHYLPLDSYAEKLIMKLVAVLGNQKR